MSKPRKPLYQMTEAELTKLIASIDTRAYRAKVKRLRRKQKALDRADHLAGARVRQAREAFTARVTPLVERAIEKQLGMKRAAWIEIDWETDQFGRMYQGNHFRNAVSACVEKLRRENLALIDLAAKEDRVDRIRRVAYGELCDLERPLDHAQRALVRAKRESLKKRLAGIRNTTAYREAKKTLNNIVYHDLGVH
jgi:GTP1/Obg family GTP-binding protein